MDLAGVLAAWAGVLVTGGLAIRAYVSERRAKQSADDTEVLRRRTVAASERSANAIEQVAEALANANKSSETSEYVPLYRGPTWSLDHVSGAKYALVNNTPYAQTDVKIAGDPIRGDAVRETQVAAFGEVQFKGLTAWGLDDKVTVTWMDNLNEKQEWSKALPPKS